MSVRATAVLLATAVFLLALAQQDPPTFRVKVDAVRIDVRVERSGRPVTGLTASNFDVRDSGVSQVIEALALEDVPLHVLLVLDTSESVRGAELAELQTAARAAISSLRADDVATVLTFSEELRLVGDLTTELQRVQVALTRETAYGLTSVHDALLHALVLRHADTRRALIIVCSDGWDTASWLRADLLRDDARRSDAVVYAVVPRPRREGAWLTEARRYEIEQRLRHWFDVEPRLFPNALLSLVTEDTGGELIYTEPARDLGSVFHGIVAQFKSRYLLTYTPEGVPPDGWHPIEVKLKEARANVKARRGYLR